jgi:hypothetical protein
MRLGPGEGQIYLWEERNRIYLKWRSDAHWDEIRLSLKAMFPYHGTLSYDGTRKLWSVPATRCGSLDVWAYATFDASDIEWGNEPIEGFFSRSRARHGGQDQYEGAQDAPEAPDAALTSAYHALHLLPTAPPELVTAAYRALAQLHHPDRGGDAAAMVQLNQAVAILRDGAMKRAS